MKQAIAFRAVGSPPPPGQLCPKPPRPDPYGVTVRPTAGAPGSTVHLSGNTPLFGEAGRLIGPSGKIGFWFNLPPNGWEHVYFGGEAPSTCQGVPVIHLGEVDVTGECSYGATFHVPHVPPGTYAIVPIEHGGTVEHGRGSAAFETIDFRVTA